MRTPDAFAAYHAHLIEAVYDCVDRLVVNCHYPWDRPEADSAPFGASGRLVIQV